MNLHMMNQPLQRIGHREHTEQTQTPQTNKPKPLLKLVVVVEPMMK